MGERIRVIVADDDAEFREALAALIAADDSLELVGVGADAPQAVELARLYRPDVAVLDVKMPGNGARAARDIRLLSPATAIVVLSAHEDQRSINEMLAGGAGSYVVKGTPARHILEAVHGSIRGQSVLSQPIASKVVSELSSRLEQEKSRQLKSAEWEARIGRILSRADELHIVFQPIADLVSGRIAGLEALSRFTSERAFGPDVWFSEAASLGHGQELDLVAVKAALGHVHLMPPGMFLSVNAHPDTVTSKELATLLEAFPARRVVVEITEHAPIHDYPGLRSAIGALRRRGVRIAVDDAGAGYASLRHILQLEPDFIKLDIELTRGIDSQRPQRALASALVAFAREIGATIAAEGIETAEELEVLRSLGVALGQGYFLGRPGPLPNGEVIEAVAVRSLSAT